MDKKMMLLGAGIFIFAFVMLTAFAPVAAISDATIVRCELVDDLIKPTSEPLATYFEENVGVGCVAIKKEKPDYESTPGFYIPKRGMFDTTPIKLLEVEN